MIVVDASVVLEVLLQTAVGRRLSPRLLAADESLHVPHLLDAEVAQVLRRFAAGRQITATRGGEAISDLGALPLTRYPHAVLLPRVWELRNNVSAYDALYVALAETLDAPLLTRDQRLAAAPHRARVEVV